MMQGGSRDARPTDFISRDDILGMIRAAFQSRDSGYSEDKKRRKDRIGSLSKTLRDMQADGHSMLCSEQIALEAKWRINYSDDWSSVDRRLDDLEVSLKNPQQDEILQQADGSWGPYYEEDYMKLEPTVEMLQKSGIQPAQLKPLRFMADFKDPKWLANYLHRLQISDIAASGRNERAELGAVQTAMSQLICKDELRELLQSPSLDFSISDEMEIGYLDYLRQTQHPRTGYWGPWYRFGGRLFAVQDLSFTFHVIHYRSGNVDNWPQIVDSTFAIKNLVYPAGWRPDADSQYSDHNNYDIVEILFHGWPHMSVSQKERARKEIAAMLEWCLTASVQGDGFASGEGEELDAYYFGVRFLDRVGFWDKAKRFWSRVEPPLPAGTPTPRDLAQHLARGFATLNDTSEEGDTVRSLLRAALCLNQPSA